MFVFLPAPRLALACFFLLSVGCTLEAPTRPCQTSSDCGAGQVCYVDTDGSRTCRAIQDFEPIAPPSREPTSPMDPPPPAGPVLAMGAQAMRAPEGHILYLAPLVIHVSRPNP